MTVRILHVVWHMNAGGIAHWLMNVLRHIDRTRYQLDFLVLKDGPSAFADEIRALGAQVIPCFGHRHPWRFARRFAGAVQEHGPYDVIHSHVYNYSGFVLMLAARQGIPARISHSHTDTRIEEAQLPWSKRLWRGGYFALTRNWIRRYATVRIGASRVAGEALFGRDWLQGSQATVIPLGLDFAPFGRQYDRDEVRRSLGLPAGALVIGHVGNYVWHKNHPFLVEILAELIGKESRAWGLLVGHHLKGSPIDEQVHALGIADRVVIAGPRRDVPRLMAGAMDVFLFPSHYEGLGLVVLEAQAAGLPCVLTDSLPEEVDRLPALIHRVPLSASPADWAAAVSESVARATISPCEAHRRMLQSPFAIGASVSALSRIYDGSEQPAAALPESAG